MPKRKNIDTELAELKKLPKNDLVTFSFRCPVSLATKLLLACKELRADASQVLRRLLEDHVEEYCHSASAGASHEGVKLQAASLEDVRTALRKKWKNALVLNLSEDLMYRLRMVKEYFNLDEASVAQLILAERVSEYVHRGKSLAEDWQKAMSEHAGRAAESPSPSKTLSVCLDTGSGKTVSPLLLLYAQGLLGSRGREWVSVEELLDLERENLGPDFEAASESLATSILDALEELGRRGKILARGTGPSRQYKLVAAAGHANKQEKKRPSRS